MPDPQFDRSTGRWYVRHALPGGGRKKQILPKHPGWKKLDRRPRSIPAEVLIYARPYQDMHARAKVGLPVEDVRADPLAPFLEAHVRSSELAGHREGSLRELRQAVRRFRAFCSSRGVASVQAVTQAACRAFVEDCAEAGKARATIAKFKGLLSPAFTRAAADGLIPRNPWAGLEPAGKKREAESPFWTDDEVTRIEAALKGRARDFFVIGIHSGFRITALLNLRWRDVLWSDPRHPEGSLVCRSESSKGGKAYRVPLFPRLREALRRLKDERGGGPDDLIFPGRRGQPMLRKTPDRWIEAAMKAACVPDRGRRCHAMRETFGTRCGARGVNPRTIMAWMNHASLKQSTKYIHFDKTSETSEVAKLGGG